MIFSFHDLKMANKGVIVERVLDGDVPDGKNYVTKKGLKMQKYAVTENSHSSLQLENNCIFFFKILKFVKIQRKSAQYTVINIIPAIGS